jgi:hypothetical protein
VQSQYFKHFKPIIVLVVISIIFFMAGVIISPFPWFAKCVLMGVLGLLVGVLWLVTL